MNPITYALITLICMIASFYFAKYFTVKSYFEDIVTNTLDRLESEGFILTKTDKDGENCCNWCWCSTWDNDRCSCGGKYGQACDCCSKR